MTSDAGGEDKKRSKRETTPPRKVDAMSACGLDRDWGNRPPPWTRPSHAALLVLRTILASRKSRHRTLPPAGTPPCAFHLPLPLPQTRIAVSRLGLLYCRPVGMDPAHLTSARSTQGESLGPCPRTCGWPAPLHVTLVALALQWHPPSIRRTTSTQEATPRFIPLMNPQLGSRSSVARASSLPVLLWRHRGVGNGVTRRAQRRRL